MLKGRAASLATIFDRIVLPWRSAEFPDFGRYTTPQYVPPKTFNFPSERFYFNPDLRLEIPLSHPPQFAKHTEWVAFDDDGYLFSELDHLEFRAMDLKSRKGLAEHFRNFWRQHAALFPGTSYIDFTINAIIAVNHANAYDAILLGDSVFYEFYALLREYAPREWQLFPESAESVKARIFTPEQVKLLSLDLSPDDLDAFQEIRASKKVASWAETWRKIIARSAPTDVYRQLCDAMDDAYETSGIREFIRGKFEFWGSVATWIGVGAMVTPAIGPLAGTASTVLGAVADLGARAFGSAEKRSAWRVLGPELNRIAQDGASRRRRSRR